MGKEASVLSDLRLISDLMMMSAPHIQLWTWTETEARHFRAPVGRGKNLGVKLDLSKGLGSAPLTVSISP